MRLSSSFTSLAAAVAVAACADANAPLATGAVDANQPFAALSSGDRLATIEWQGTRPTLYMQDIDGSNRFQVHFAHVHGHVTGNYSPQQLPVTDESLVSIQRIKWSPDGRHLAAIVQPAYGSAQVVLISADGRDIRTVSPNSQYLWGDVEWSPDSRHIAYAMATGPYGLLPDLFVTDLGPDFVRRITTSGKLSGYDTFRFDAAGTQLLFTEHVGFARDGINIESRLGTANVSTGAVSYGPNVVGEPQGFARDGSWLLLLRMDLQTGLRDLIRMSLPGGTETVLTTGDLWNAVVQEGDQEAILVSAGGKGSSGLSFTLIGLAVPDDFHGPITPPKDAVWVALLRRS